MGASVLAVGFTHEEIDRAGLLGHVAGHPASIRRAHQPIFARASSITSCRRRRRVGSCRSFSYVDRCTSPRTGCSSAGFLVEVPFYAQRLFAAGQEYFGAYFGSAANEQFAFDRFERQIVPFAIIPSDDLAEFDSRFPLVAAYVHAHYSPLTNVPLNAEQTIHILVNRDTPATSRDPETGWPCFQPPS